MFKSKVLWIALGAALLLSLVIGGAVVAQGPFAQRGFADQDGDGQCDMLALGGAAGRGMMGGRGGLGFGMMAGWQDTSLVSVTAQQLNLTAEQVVSELGTDKTLEQVILAHNGNPQAVVDAFVAARKAVLDQLVTDGRLPQAQEDQMLTNVREQATENIKTVGACTGAGVGCAGAANGGNGQVQPRGGCGGMMGGGLGQGLNRGGRGRTGRSA